MEQEMKENHSSGDKKPKTWDEAILELKGFIINAKKEELKQKAEKTKQEEK